MKVDYKGTKLSLHKLWIVLWMFNEYSVSKYTDPETARRLEYDLQAAQGFTRRAQVSLGDGDEERNVESDGESQVLACHPQHSGACRHNLHATQHLTKYSEQHYFIKIV